MKSKLTLELNKDIIEQAKEFAKTQNVSLSDIVEAILKKMIADHNEPGLPSLVESLSGVIELDEESDYKSEYMEYLAKKYG